MRTELLHNARTFAAEMYEWHIHNDEPQNNAQVEDRAVCTMSDYLYYELDIEDFDLTHPLIGVFVDEALATYRRLWSAAEPPFARYLRECGWTSDEEA